VILAVVVTLLVTLLQILPPRIYQAAIDNAITPGVRAKAALQTATDPALIASLKQQVDAAPPRLFWIAGLLVLVVGMRNVFSYINATTLTWVGHRFVFDLRFATWRHLQRLSLAYHNATQTGKIMARVTADIELIQGLIQGQLVQFITDLVTLIAVLVMLFFLEWRLALMIVGLVPFYVVAYLSFLKHIRHVSGEQRRLYDEMLGKGNLDRIDEFVTDDVVDHEERLPGQPEGKDGVVFFVNAMRGAFSDIKATVGASVESGDMASAGATITGRHTGEFMGVPATDKSFEIEAIDIIRIEDGKCAEHWGVTDNMALMVQIGAVPAPA